MNTRYFLLYDDGNYLKFIDNKPIIYQDIAEIDLMTIDYSKEEFQKEKNILENNNIIILKVILNKDKQCYNISLYNPLFQTKNKLNEKRFNQIKKIILERLSNVKMHKKDKSIKLSYDYQSLLNNLFKEIITNSDMASDLHSKTSLINLKIKDYIKEMNGKDYNWLFSKTKDILKSYIEFRNLLLEFINYYRKDLINDLSFYENYLFPSEVFLYQTSFYINLSDASNDLEKKIDEENIEEEFSLFRKLLQIKKAKFDDYEIGQVFKIEGLKGVMEKFDGNRIYSSTKDDLLRLGILSDEEYLRDNHELKP